MKIQKVEKNLFEHFKLGRPNKIPKAAAIKPETINEPTKPRSGNRKIRLNIAKAPAAIKPTVPPTEIPMD